MLFSVDYDVGGSIGFYLVPDTGGTVPSVRIAHDGVEIMVLPANQNRPELVDSGRHSTGMCGFIIDDSVIPGVAGLPHLDINEAETGLEIYRRPRGTFLNDKVFRLETHLLPLWRIDDALKDRFQYWYRGIDRRGIETSMQVFCIVDLKSAYISGRLFIKSIELYLTQGFKSVVIFRDPYEELAERLIILKNVTDKTRELLGPRDMLTFEPVIESLGEFEKLEEDALRRFVRRAPNEVLTPLSNPLTRQLSCGTPDETPKKTSVAQSLSALAAFDVVCLRSDAKHFSEALGEMLGLPGETPIPVMNEYARVTELAQKLRTISEVEGLLELDLNIFTQTQHAFGSVG